MDFLAISYEILMEIHGNSIYIIVYYYILLYIIIYNICDNIYEIYAIYCALYTIYMLYLVAGQATPGLFFFAGWLAGWAFFFFLSWGALRAANYQEYIHFQ